MAKFAASVKESLSGGRLPELFATIGAIVAVAMALAWRVRFRPGRLDLVGPAAVDAEPDIQQPQPAPEAPLPPSAFLSAVEEALGQTVVSLRLRTPSDVFKLEPPARRA